MAFMISGRVAPLGRRIISRIFAVLLSARGVAAFFAGADLATFLQALPALALVASFFGAVALSLAPLAAFRSLGGPFFWLASFFEAAFSGATCAPCAATVAALSVVVVSGVVMCVFVTFLRAFRARRFITGRPERQENSTEERNRNAGGCFGRRRRRLVIALAVARTSGGVTEFGYPQA